MNILLSLLNVFLITTAVIAVPPRKKYTHPYRNFGRSPRNPHFGMNLSFTTNTRLTRFESVHRKQQSSYCVPGQACWPTPNIWSMFNASVDGTLIAVAPPLAACFDWNGIPPNPAVCDANIANFSNSYWRSSQPGALQEPNWEQDPVTGADCFDATKPCSLGNIPPFAVAATTPEQITKTLQFGALHNIRIVVRSSGHEYQGRSSGENGLLVWVHAMKGVNLLHNYTVCPGDVPRTVITTRPGTSWGEVYAVGAQYNLTVVGGSEISVSSCGGYTMGGGHSWQSPAFGMAVDNVLSYEVVLANGTFVTASACMNSDLFWALRGGGGTFGVVTTCTYVTHPYPDGGASGAFITVELLQEPASLAVLLDGFLDWSTVINSPDSPSPITVGGYFIPDFYAPGDPNPAHSHVSLLLGFNGTTDQANTALASLGAWVNTVPQYLTVIGADVLPFPSLLQFHEYFDDSSEATGQAQTLGSRLIPRDIMKNDTARALIAETLTSIAYDVGGLTGMLVAGGAVAAADPYFNETSLNPAWRLAGCHIAWGIGWPLNTTLATQASLFNGISTLTDSMRLLTPSSGAYWSESDYLAPDWEDELYGSNYPRLQEIKRRYDPTGLFTVHHGVELP
jgi:FAD/FMN-containing dehydrogenase